MTIEAHDQAVMDAFASVLMCEDMLRRHKAELEEAVNRLRPVINRAEADLDKAWEAVSELMRESGEYEILLPGAASDYKITYSQGTEVVTGDPQAAPDEWVKTERTLKKKELLAHLKQLRENGEALPNWANLERTPAKLGYRLMKKSA
ncbi:hypothetical protein [Zavarzinella formosa]|uniref:hypothetical protein n=1 Tax=Zavarzinella formosa TaxID=360055 RepID=UPI00030B299A|nr:hypothetical protein [Zavarzinella formosa]